MPSHRARSMSNQSRTGNYNRGAGDHPFQELEFTLSAKRQLSCAECRRLKRRCDRQWPCQSCISRGCASICPEGTLAPGGGSKFILHGSEHLHKKIKEMSERITELEGAVASTTTNPDEHPLLRKDLLRIKLPPDTQNVPSENHTSSGDVREEDTELGEIIHELGTLKLNSEGHMNFMGRTAKIEYILNTENISPSVPSKHETFADKNANANPLAISVLPPDIISLAESFIMSAPRSSTIDMAALKVYLPPVERGMELCRSFFSNAGWYHRPMDEDQFMSENFAVIYGLPSSYARSNHSHGSSPDSPLSAVPHSPHDLALLFIVLSTGALVDLTQSPISEEAEAYCLLAKAAMCLESPCGGCSLALVRTLNTMINHHILWEQKTVGIECAWIQMGFATSMAMQLGLHRDSDRWGLGEKETEDRRRAFWELFATNCWQTLGYGRPPTLHLNYIDCQMPRDPGAFRGPDGEVVSRSYEGFNFRFVRDCIWPIVDLTFNIPSGTSYSAVVDLDKRVKDYKLPDLVCSTPDRTSLEWTMQNHMMICSKEYAVLHIHRTYFTRALSSYPNAPLDCSYGPSVMATFKSAVTLLQQCKTTFQTHPALLSRFWLTSTFILKGAVAMGSICSRGPRGSLAPAAFAQLNTVVDLAQSAHFYSQRVGKILPALFRLQHKAHNAISSVGPGPTSMIGAGLLDHEDDVSEDELAAYGGVARVLMRNRHSMSPASYSPNSQSLPSTRHSPDVAVDTNGAQYSRSSSQQGSHSRRPSANLSPANGGAGTHLPFDIGLNDSWSVPISGLVQDKSVPQVPSHGPITVSVVPRANSLPGNTLIATPPNETVAWMDNYNFANANTATATTASLYH